MGIVLLTTFAQALIWGVNTLFLMDAGLDIFGVMVANGAFAAGQVLFEVPTGVVADTVGRRVSYLLCVAILFVATLLYVWLGAVHAGLLAFVLASILLGLGYTFFTGAVEAWLVDALAAAGYTGKVDVVFSRGGIAQGVAMLLGTVLGGLLGQLDLAVPYLLRAAMLVPAGVLGFFFMRDAGFVGRRIRLSSFAEETRTIARAGVTYGLQSAVVRPLMLAGLIQGAFFMYGFYSWQRYFLDLLGRDLVWVNGVIAALVGLAGIAGAALVAPLARTRLTRPLVVFAMVAAQGVLVVMAGLLQAFWLAVPLYLLSTLAYGLQAPVRQAWLNARIPSEQRATIISLDSLFQEAGGAAGQVGLGYLSRAYSIPAAWVVGGVWQLLALPFIARARAAETASTAAAPAAALAPPPDCSRPLAGQRAC